MLPTGGDVITPHPTGATPCLEGVGSTPHPAIHCWAFPLQTYKMGVRPSWVSLARASAQGCYYTPGDLISPFYLLPLVISEQELLPCDSDAFIEGTAMQMAISGIETVTLRFKGAWRNVPLRVLALVSWQHVIKSLASPETHHVAGNWIPRKCLNQHRT